MKVNINNVDNINGIKRFSLKRVAKRGIFVASTLFLLGNTFSGCNHKKEQELNSMISNTNIDVDVSLDNINGMNIIINDNDCSDTFFNEVCDKLREDGLEIKETKNNDGINSDNNVVITLDQQYSAGTDTLIFAPYNNTRIGYSDSLALSMQTAFKQNGFLGNYIYCGKVGYREDENGNICTTIPTETEEALDTDSDVSFVTISFGTKNTNSELVAKSIENGLARQFNYVNSYDTGSDLIYRASENDSIEVIADYFNTDINTLNNFNKINSERIVDSQPILNPDISSMEVFNQNTIFGIDNNKTRFY